MIHDFQPSTRLNKAAEFAVLQALADDAIEKRGGMAGAKYARLMGSLKVNRAVGQLPREVAKLHYTCCPTCDYQDWVKSDDEVLAPGEICYECVIEKAAQERRDFWDDGEDDEYDSAPVFRRVQFSHAPF